MAINMCASQDFLQACNYDAVKCCVALNNKIVEDVMAKLRDGSRVDTKRCATDALPRSNMRDHVIYDIPGYQETSNPDYLSYANATNINTTDRQEIRSENSDTFDEDEIPPNDIRSPESGYNVPGERIATSDLPEHLLILSPRRNEATPYASSEWPKISNDSANVYASTLSLPKPSVHETKVQDAYRQISTSASRSRAQSNSTDRNSKPHESFHTTSEPASMNSNSQVNFFEDLHFDPAARFPWTSTVYQAFCPIPANALLSTPSSQFLHPSTCLRDANYSSNASSPYTEQKQKSVTWRQVYLP
ncbi:hypothetical protein EGR_04894 [Echinococcus granulosus]|uniref:Uncharacterized protein n=1 Tax=Echinococcus granulosus TaxID=6210 RepID=W6V2L6_ECHGR|nr:hypothetical protein EGR_04894 [Echinococcus granulosus]EUB60184.1 hypothetical protein EGR_04894 [Echinococcus granulosus]